MLFSQHYDQETLKKKKNLLVDKIIESYGNNLCEIHF